MDKLGIDWDYDRSSRLRYRRFRKSVPKEAMVEIANRLDIDPSGKKPELRLRIIEHVHGFETSKSGETTWNTNELYRINRALHNASLLKADEVDIWDDVGAKSLITIVTPDETYEVEIVEKGRSKWAMSWPDPPSYEEYEMYKLAGRHFDNNRRHRLMVLRGLDYDECKYRSSVVLEQPVDHGPYKRWRKLTYVQDVINENEKVDHYA